MSDLFEENDEDTDGGVGGNFDEVEDDLDVASDLSQTTHQDVGARRRLEDILDEKRLLNELKDDFGDY
jgi:hypothetical protein